jgi:putative flippase GtrA
MSADENPASPDSVANRGLARHLGGFVVSGIVAFSVDATVLEAGVRLAALDPRIARIAAVLVATVVAWQMHRRFTFAVATPSSFAELGRYAAAAWIVAAVNYSTFFVIISAQPDLTPLTVLVLSTAVATVMSYGAMRYGVFRPRN